MLNLIYNCFEGIAIANLDINDEVFEDGGLTRKHVEKADR